MFRTWLIANLSIAYYILAAIIIGISALVISPVEESITWSVCLIGIGIASLAIIITEEPNIGPITSILLGIGGYLLMTYILKNPESGAPTEQTLEIIRKINTGVISLSIVSTLPAFFIARYAYTNFRDVVSRRWLWKNSGKDVFESQWKYTFNRFCMAWLLVVCLGLDIALVILFATNPNLAGTLMTLFPH